MAERIAAGTYLSGLSGLTGHAGAVDDDFTAQELTHIRALAAVLVPVWGYRTGNHSEHENFEAATHGHLPASQGGHQLNVVQEITDALFRNLQQLWKGQTHLFVDDIVGKARWALQVVPQAHPTVLEWFSKLIHAFLAKRGVSDAVRSLATLSAAVAGLAPPYRANVAVLVAMARVIIACALAEWDVVWKLLQAVVEAGSPKTAEKAARKAAGSHKASQARKAAPRTGPKRTSSKAPKRTSTSYAGSSAAAGSGSASVAAFERLHQELEETIASVLSMRSKIKKLTELRDSLTRELTMVRIDLELGVLSDDPEVPQYETKITELNADVAKCDASIGSLHASLGAEEAKRVTLEERLGRM